MKKLFKIDEPVWYVETYSNCYPDIWCGKLVDIQKDKALILIGRQTCGANQIKYEDVIWGIPLRDVFSFDEYDEAIKKLEIYAEEYKRESENKKETQGETNE